MLKRERERYTFGARGGLFHQVAVRFQYTEYDSEDIVLSGLKTTDLEESWTPAKNQTLWSAQVSVYTYMRSTGATCAIKLSGGPAAEIHVSGFAAATFSEFSRLVNPASTYGPHVIA